MTQLIPGEARLHVALEDAMQSYADESPYSAAKAAILDLAKGISKAHAKHGRADSTERLLSAMSRLPEAYRTLLLLQVRGRYSLEEIARELSLPKEHISAALAAARQYLRDLCGEDTSLDPLLEPYPPRGRNQRP